MNLTLLPFGQRGRLVVHDFLDDGHVTHLISFRQPHYSRETKGSQQNNHQKTDRFFGGYL